MLPAIASLRIGIVDAGAIGTTLALAVRLAVAGYTVSVLARARGGIGCARLVLSKDYLF